MKLFCKHDFRWLYNMNNGDWFYCDKCGKYEYFNKHLNVGFKTKTPPHLRIPNTGIGDLSDGYHTFNELYHHRAMLFSVICNSFTGIAWKSRQHHDGSMYDGMFIVGIDTPEGTATYHYNDKYWNEFLVKELENAPEWDGHSSEDAIARIKSLEYWKK